MTPARAIWCGFLLLSMTILFSSKLAPLGLCLIPLFWIGKPRKPDRWDEIQDQLSRLQAELQREREK